MKPTSALFVCVMAVLIAVSTGQTQAPWYQSFVDWNQQALANAADWNQEALSNANSAIAQGTGTDLAAEYEKFKTNAANAVSDWSANAQKTIGKRSVDRARRYAS